MLAILPRSTMFDVFVICDLYEHFHSTTEHHFVVASHCCLLLALELPD